MIRRWTRLACVALVAASCWPAAWSKDLPPRKEFHAPALASRWHLWAGGLLASFDTQAAWSPTGFAGGLIQLESDLGLDEHVDTLLLGVTYRKGPRQSYTLSYNTISREATREAKDQIEWGKLVFDVGAEVTTTLDTDEVKAIWRYDFSDSERLNAGVSAGLSTFFIDVSLGGAASIGEVGSVEQNVEGSSFMAPIPVIGFYVDYAFSPKWILRATMNTIRGDYDDMSARIIESGISAEFYPTRVFGLGFGTTNSDIEYSSIQEDEKLAVGYRVSGFMGYATFSF